MPDSSKIEAGSCFFFFSFPSVTCVLTSCSLPTETPAFYQHRILIKAYFLLLLLPTARNIIMSTSSCKLLQLLIPFMSQTRTQIFHQFTKINSQFSSVMYKIIFRSFVEFIMSLYAVRGGGLDEET